MPLIWQLALGTYSVGDYVRDTTLSTLFIIGQALQAFFLIQSYRPSAAAQRAKAAAATNAALDRACSDLTATASPNVGGGSNWARPGQLQTGSPRAGDIP